MQNRGHKNSNEANSKGVANEKRTAKGGAYLRPPALDTHSPAQTSSPTKPSLLPKGIPLQANMNSISPLQMKTIDAVEGTDYQEVDNFIFLDKKLVKVGYYWEADVGEKDDRNTLIGEIAAKAGAIGTAAGTQPWTIIEGNIGNEEIADTIDPFMVRISGKYGDAKDDMKLDYHFGSSWHGYVIKVEDAGKGINKKMAPFPTKDLAKKGFPVATHFSNIHSSRGGDTPIAEKDGADEVTKLAGEGARWNCIRTGLSSVSDNTKIYTNENKDGKVTEQMRYITFPVLWKSWAATFNKGFNISDETVVGKLKGDNVRIKKKDATEDSPVSLAANKDFAHPRDISVDNPKPASAPELKTSKSFKFVHFTKNVAPLMSKSESMAKGEADFKTELAKSIPVGNIHQVGYAGANEFVALCTVPALQAKLDVKGYVSNDGKHNDIKFPHYREAAAKAYAKNEISGKAMTGGAAIYAKEKEAEYDKLVASAATYFLEILGAEDESLTLEGLKTRIKHLVNWTDVNTALPAVGKVANQHHAAGTLLEKKEEDDGDEAEVEPPREPEPDAKLSAKDLRKLKKQKQKEARELVRDRRGPGGKRSGNKRGGGGASAAAGSDTE